ncbi:MAG: hypothetical protein RBS57_12175, partial [Desulforhabdus sp.]|nr:hypothetical protein [Desulforhabdus sp.]
GELKRRGIEVIVYQHVADNIDNGPEQEENGRDKGSLCPDILPPHDGPTVVLVDSQTLTNCAEKLNSPKLFLAVPIYFRKNMAQSIRNLHQNGTGNQGRLRIYDYVDQRIGLLENYFRMRSYNYGVHPDVLLNLN